MNKSCLNAGKYITINIVHKTLDLYQGSHLVRSYNLAVGKPSTPTPTGQYKIVTKIINPGSSLGTRWLGLSVSTGHYGIHGTNVPSSIGKAVTNGCIRMYNEDVGQLFPLVNISTPVFIVAESKQPKPADSQYDAIEDYTNENINGHDNEDLEEQQINNVLETIQLEANKQPEATGFYYKTIPGDNLWTVARRFGLPVQLLINQNPLEKLNRIYPGQNIFIPKVRIR